MKRAVGLLNVLATDRPTAKLAELSRAVGIPRSSALALCNTLVETGLMIHSPDGSYGLGPHVLELSRAYLSQTDLHTVFERVVRETQALPDHTLVLSVLEGPDVVYIGRRYGRRSVSVPYELGMRLPANCTASGKALLCHLSEKDIRARYEKGLESLTERSITDLETLLEELDRWRELGYAVDEEETALGMTCVGAPIYDNSSEVVGAVALSAVKAGLEGRGLTEAAVEVQRIASQVSAVLGAPVS